MFAVKAKKIEKHKSGVLEILISRDFLTEKIILL